MSTAAPDAPLALDCRQLTKIYGQRTVLHHLNLQLAAGDYVAIMGESGVGKSTLLNLIAGLDAPDSGSLHIAGTRLDAMNDDAATLLPHLTVQQNSALPLVLNSLPVTRASEMISAVGLQGREHDFPRQLSGGEMQRVAIARALVHRPRLLLADEPTGNLDPETAADILQLIRNEIHNSAASGIIVTHSPAAAASADRILLLTRDGLKQISADEAHAR